MKIKRAVILILCFLMCLSFVSCSGNEKSGRTAETTAALQKTIDVDLTSLTSTMVYSEVYNMMITPEDYKGKTVKMKGQFSVYTNEETGDNYFAVIIADAAACCQQGLEFVLEGEHSYPEDYPQAGAEVEVTGEFQTYQEGELTYCRLVASEMSVC